MSESTTPPARDDGDVADLMATVRKRVAERKAQGLYSVDGLQTSARRDVEPFRVQDLVWLEEVAEITPDMSLVRSTKPGVGMAVGKAKAALTKATSQPLLDLAVRQSQFNAALLAYITELAQEVEVLRARVAEVEGDASPEARS